MTPKHHDVVIAAYDGVHLSGITWATEILDAANRCGASYRVTVAAVSDRAATSDPGVRLGELLPLTQLPSGRRTLVVPAGDRAVPPVIAAAADASARAVRLAPDPVAGLLALVADDHGPALAGRVADELLLTPDD